MGIRGRTLAINAETRLYSTESVRERFAFGASSGDRARDIFFIKIFKTSVRVCYRCWNEPAVERWHESGWRKGYDLESSEGEEGEEREEECDSNEAEAAEEEDAGGPASPAPSERSNAAYSSPLATPLPSSPE